MKVRQATRADMADVAELSRQLAAHVDDPDPGANDSILLECGFGPDRWFECLIVEDGDRIVGFALFCRKFEAHTRTKRLWLGDLYIAQNKRRKGIGQVLIAAVRSRAAELGCATVDFELARGNATARAFYKQLGAAICEDVEPLRLSVPEIPTQ
jgi:GNAT superfamily N-acetyltransferase